VNSSPASLAGRDPDLLARYRLIVTDPWEFCVRCVFTLDQVDKKNPVKKFPSHYKYLKLYTRVWEREKLIIVPKSRRMFMSWCNIALYLHDTMFSVGRTNVFQSKKEEDSDALIERAKFILEHIPESEIPKDLIPAWEKTYCHLKFPEIHSEIVGVPQGADQHRSLTASGVLFDEFAFWEKAEDTYSAAMPTIEGGGRCTIISSAAPGYMEKLVYDTLETMDDKSL